MQPNEVPPYPWHTVTTAYVTGFSRTAAKHDAIAVFVDALRYKSIFVLPIHILSDQGTQFTGLLSQSLAERLGYTWKLTTAHALWSDGQTERTNRLFQDVLCFC